MEITLEQPVSSSSAAVRLPPRMRLLFIGGYQRIGGWLAEAFASESGSDVLLEEAVGGAAGMVRLRDEVFDAVLVSHDPDQVDARSVVAGIRGGGSDEPVIVLGHASESEMLSAVFEAGGDAYLCANTTTASCLMWTVARAVERTLIARENRRLLEAERQRLELEHQEADRLLAQQRSLLGDLEEAVTQSGHDVGPHILPAGSTAAPSADRRERPSLPEQLVEHYSELLKAYVIMGSGNLTDEMRSLAEMLGCGGVSSHEIMLMHLGVLEELVRGLGSRSARHVMNRADLLLLEITVHLAEEYRQRLFKRHHPPTQLQLPGF